MHEPVHEKLKIISYKSFFTHLATQIATLSIINFSIELNLIVLSYFSKISLQNASAVTQCDPKRVTACENDLFSDV